MGERGPSAQDLIRWGESLAAIARTGLGFTASLYERERFEEVLRVAGEIRATADALVAEEARSAVGPGAPEGPEGEASRAAADGRERVAEWLRDVGEGVAGYVTPKVAVGAVVGNERGELLLVQRADSGAWLYPTGWADVGYSAVEVAVKEVREETGIEVEPVRLVMVLDGLRLGFTRVPLYSLVFHCRKVGGELRPHPLECADVGWFAEGALPSPLAGAGLWVPHAFAAIRGEPLDVLYDAPREPVWRSMPGEQGADGAAGPDRAAGPSPRG